MKGQLGIENDRIETLKISFFQIQAIFLQVKTFWEHSHF